MSKRGKINLNGKKSVHFIGIGGISMSGFAEILHREGFNISGSDDNSSDITKRLQRLGISVAIPTAAENITDDIDMVVYTAAIKPFNPEFRAAAEKKLPLMERAAFVGLILPGYENTVCVAGTHGKTTTTSMVAEIAMAAGLDPTVSIGGHMNRGGLNYRIGSSPCFVLEACEYSNSFSHWHPQVGMILNIEADHLDFFGSLDNVTRAFGKFASNVRPGGTLIIASNIPDFEAIIRGLDCEIVTFGMPSEGAESARFWPRNISYSNGRPSFDVMDGEKFLARVDLPMPGKYNMLNALASFAVACSLGISPEVTAAALSDIMGIKRRYEFKGTWRGIEIVDDYAHHPTEIRSCLSAAKASALGRIVCVFQSHTYTRTKSLFDDFADSFDDADKIILVPIFAARESFDPSVSSKMLAEEICKRGGDAISVESFDEAGKFLRSALCSGDLLITMGAGDVYKVGEELLRV
ncbi:MAG: UDP-N-acetylmuramate--L-alanine ligase [Defluviitaleaceae bacterium]|nr:UDP-N-acetylmuramate--L-alanine ligase [Defluviitaleaceae bacterium]